MIKESLFINPAARLKDAAWNWQLKRMQKKAGHGMVDIPNAISFDASQITRPLAFNPSTGESRISPMKLHLHGRGFYDHALETLRKDVAEKMNNGYKGARALFRTKYGTIVPIYSSKSSK